MLLLSRILPSFRYSIVSLASSTRFSARARSKTWDSASAFSYAIIPRSNSSTSTLTSTEDFTTQPSEAADIQPYAGPSRPPKLNQWGSKGSRILWLESCFAWGMHGTTEVHTVSDIYAYPQAQPQEKFKEWIKKIKELVEKDSRKPPSERIDSVVWYVESRWEPKAEMWQALDGLSPKHLQILAGFDEGFDVEGLGTLQRPWTELETLCLSGTIESSFIDKSPKVFSQISSLSLDYCCAYNLVPPGATHLKHLQITENNACDMFSYAVDDERNPRLAEQLQRLEIQTTNGCDMTSIYEPQDFRERLKKCTNLRELRYSAGMSDGLDVMLAGYIPLSIETLMLRFTRSLPFLRAFDDWIAHASDPTWLPRLKSFKMTVDPEGRARDLKAEEGYPSWSGVKVDTPPEFPVQKFDQEFEAKRRELYKLLKINKPSIDLY